MIKEYIKNSLFNALEILVQEDFLSKDAIDLAANSLITLTKSASHGDYSLNTAMLLAKPEKKNPLEIANKIVDKLALDSGFLKVEVASVGFINIFINDELLTKVVKTVIDNKENYGKTFLKESKKVLIEFVSANPTGGLHLGHARPAFVGDALAKVLDAAGFCVTKEFYVNDTGNQVETLARTIYKRYQELFGLDVTIEKGEYPGAYVIDIAKALKNKDADKWLNKDESQWLKELIVFGVEYNLAQIKKTLDKLGICFDKWFLEHNLHEDSSLNKLLQKYESLNMLYEAESAVQTEKFRRAESKAALYSHLQEGGIFLKTSLFGDDEDRVIQRKDKRFVYLTADLAYHDEKYLRNYDLMIDVFGADHAGHVNRIKAGMTALGHDAQKLKFVLVQMVRLLRDGIEVKFSKRAGEVYGIDDLIDEIGQDAARFVFLMRSSQSQFDLDLESLKLQNNDNPVFYVQYAHARMNTILEKSYEVYPDWQKYDYDSSLQKKLVLLEEKEMLIKVAELPEVIKESAASLESHRLIFYAQDLVKLFHSYFTKYRSEQKIISSDRELSIARLYLVFVVKQALFNTLNILGISAPKYMSVAKE